MFLEVPVPKPRIEGLPGVDETLTKFKRNETAPEGLNLKEYEGQYFSVFSLLEVKLKNRKPILTHPGIKDIELVQTHPDDFGLIRFTRDENKKIKSFTITSEQISFTKKL